MVKGKARNRDLIGFLITLAILILINVIGSYLYVRLDLTSEHRYSLSEPTEELLKNLDDQVYVTVYLEGNFPASFKRLRNETREMLDEFANTSKGELEFDFINPSESPDMKERDRVYRNLYDAGLRPTDLEIKDEDGISKKIVWPGAIIRYRDKEVAVQLLKSQFGAPPEVVLNQSIESLEYELAAAIKRITKPAKKKIAFIEGHGELNKFETADAMRALREVHEVERVALNGDIRALASRSFIDDTLARVVNKFDLIIIADPDSAFDEKDKFIIDQYIMYGGKVIWMIDPVEASMDSLRNKNTMLAIPRELNLGDQLFSYGVRFNQDLVQDLRAAPIPIVSGQYGTQVKTQLYPWLFFPLLISKNNHPINKNIDVVRAQFASTIDLVGNDELKKTVVLSSSEKSKIVRAPTRVSLNMLSYEPPVAQFNKKDLPIGVLVEGKFKSIYAHRLTPKMYESGEINYRHESKESMQLFIADGDLIKNRYNSQTNEYYALGMDKYTQQMYGNKDFFLNAVNYMLDESGLILSNTKSFKIRLLNRELIAENRLMLQLLNTAVPIGLVLIFGLVFGFVRRRKYS
jgi:ABC-2 type transport system permease protein